MRITKYGHSCALLEEAGARLLLDPGVFATGLEDVTGLTAILVTHQHPDHLDVDNVRRLRTANPAAELLADEGSAEQLESAGLSPRAVHDGDELTLGGVRVRVAGRDHAVIHPEIPIIPNVGYLVADRFFYPGDAFTDPGVPVDVLGLPTAAPWMKISESIEYLRRVRPQLAVPLHDGILSAPQIYYAHYERFGGQQQTEFRTFQPAVPLEV